MSDTHLEDLADRIRPSAVSNLLLWLILGFVAIFVIWASVVELDRTVHAPGRVVPSSRLQVLSNFEGGIVSQILVRAGDVVRRGQPLVRLDRTQAGPSSAARRRPSARWRPRSRASRPRSRGARPSTRLPPPRRSPSRSASSAHFTRPG